MFSKYHKISNLEEGQAIRYPGDYVAIEKVHGSNFGIYILPDNTIQCAKRNSMLGDADFFGHFDMIENIRTTLNNIAEYLRGSASCRFVGRDDDMSPRQDVIIIYGEIFGGVFQGVSKAKTVQKGVEYCPDIQFYAFDIKINDKFLCYNDFEDACKKSRLFYAKALVRGSLDKLLNLDSTFESTISDRLGLGHVDGNFAEGYIIKPVIGVLNSFNKRVIWKHKSPRFSENQPKPIPSIDISDPDFKFMFAALFPKICKNRLDNIMSHGPELPKNHERLTLVGMIIKDAIDESHYANIHKKVRKKLVKLLTPEASRVVEFYES